MRLSSLLAGALCAAALVAPACSGGEPPRWISLAREPGVLFAASDAPLRLADGRVFARRSEAGEQWLETTLERSAWSFEPETRGGVWTAPLGARARGRSAAGVEARLTGGGRAFDHVPVSHDASVPFRLGEGSFATLPGRLLLRLAAGDEPPGSATLSVWAGEGPRARIAGRRFSGDGFALASGERATLALEVPEGSELRFATLLEPAFAAAGAPARFRVLVDGETAFERELDAGGEQAERHALPLRAGRRTLAFEVAGGFAWTGFLAPRVVPAAAAGAPHARPDLVVFLADTLRADALAAYGGTLGVTPFLDELAGRARVFRRAWSTGTYTLPAHASMFTGAFPHQVGIVGTDNGVPEDLVTIAEHLRERGYRTGAITDSVVVTQALGLAQGFEWFDELHATLGSTLERARAFLDDDDGRPAFLFVHTYRAHLPYRVTRRTREAWGERLGLEGDPDRLRARIQELVESPPETPGRAQEIEAALARIRSFYWAGVVDLDEGVRRFCEDLEARGLLARGALVFASDHGEAFGEHGLAYHRDKVYEVLARVPLLLCGAGVEPGLVDHAASLVDLPRTLCALAGVAPRPEWAGTSLLELAAERPTFVFECRNQPDSTLAVVEGAHKLIGFERTDALLGAFDLARDPHEEENLLPSGAGWPRELQARTRATLETLLRPQVEPVPARLDAEQEDRLRAMGYGGD